MIMARKLSSIEVERRGCLYCDELKHRKDFMKPSERRNDDDLSRNMCPHEKCPFTELDDIKYEYLEEYDYPLQEEFHMGIKRIIMKS